MKIRAEVLAVETTGDQLSIKMQGNAPSASAGWRTMEVVDVRLADTKINRRAFRVGRSVTVIIKPEADR